MPKKRKGDKNDSKTPKRSRRGKTSMKDKNKDKEEFSEEEFSEEEFSEEEFSEEDQMIDLRNILPLFIGEEEKKKDGNTLYLETLSKKKRKELEKEEKKILELSIIKKPLRYQIIESGLLPQLKSTLLQKVSLVENINPSSGEYFKVKKYMDGVLKIPFGKYTNLPIKKQDPTKKINKFMEDLGKKMDECIYGQDNAKSSLLEVIAKWITNPLSTGNVIGLCGPPGVGKTSLIKNGLSKALNVPFGFVTLGGSSYSSMLDGFDYTYEGSKWGRIVDILIENKTMNPIIFFDELDKISETKSGEEIASMLIHLTDSTQNNSFNDKYFAGIDLDLSKAFLIFSFNNESKIHPILKDRIKIIKMDSFNIEQKIVISKKYSIDKICKNIGFSKENFEFSDETIRVISSTYCSGEKGVRKMEKCLETLVMKLNLIKLTNSIGKMKLEKDFVHSYPFVITPDVATKILDPVFRPDNMSIAVRMMYS